MFKTLLLIFVGGGIGSLLRYGLQLALHQRTVFCIFPLATFSVNIVGSFCIGLFYAWSTHFNLSDDTRLFLTTGLCGGFTTFSTFSQESMLMLRQGLYTPFIFYILLSILFGIAAVFAGSWIGMLRSS